MSLNMLNFMLWPIFVIGGVALGLVFGVSFGAYRAVTHKKRKEKKLMASLDKGKREVDLAQLKKDKKKKKTKNETQTKVDTHLEERKKKLEENQINEVISVKPEEVQENEIIIVKPEDEIVLNTDFELKKIQTEDAQSFNIDAYVGQSTGIYEQPSNYTVVTDEESCNN